MDGEHKSQAEERRNSFHQTICCDLSLLQDDNLEFLEQELRREEEENSKSYSKISHTGFRSGGAPQGDLRPKINSKWQNLSNGNSNRRQDLDQFEIKKEESRRRRREEKTSKFSSKISDTGFSSGGAQHCDQTQEINSNPHNLSNGNNNRSQVLDKFDIKKEESRRRRKENKSKFSSEISDTGFCSGGSQQGDRTPETNTKPHNLSNGNYNRRQDLDQFEIKKEESRRRRREEEKTSKFPSKISDTGFSSGGAQHCDQTQEINSNPHNLSNGNNNRSQVLDKFEIKKEESRRRRKENKSKFSSKISDTGFCAGGSQQGDRTPETNTKPHNLSNENYRSHVLDQFEIKKEESSSANEKGEELNDVLDIFVDMDEFASLDSLYEVNNIQGNSGSKIPQKVNHKSSPSTFDIKVNLGDHLMDSTQQKQCHEKNISQTNPTKKTADNGSVEVPEKKRKPHHEKERNPDENYFPINYKMNYKKNHAREYFSQKSVIGQKTDGKKHNSNMLTLVSENTVVGENMTQAEGRQNSSHQGVYCDLTSLRDDHFRQELQEEEEGETS